MLHNYFSSENNKIITVDNVSCLVSRMWSNKTCAWTKSYMCTFRLCQVTDDKKIKAVKLPITL